MTDNRVFTIDGMNKLEKQLRAKLKVIENSLEAMEGAYNKINTAHDRAIEDLHRYAHRMRRMVAANERRLVREAKLIEHRLDQLERRQRLYHDRKRKQRQS